jgi:tRNA(His) 5'-end guanylyltransferase
MSEDSLGDRMKMYEMAEAGRMLDTKLPVMIRLDGKAFHTFTKGLKRPYDVRLSTLMADTTRHLVGVSNAILGYTQSDEISLVLYMNDPQSQMYFNGRIQKLTSIMAASATLYFNKHLPMVLPEKSMSEALFDCRVWNVPSLVEAANCIYWRELDATKNSISMAAQSQFSHKALHGKNSAEKIDMLKSVGVDWQSFPSFFRRGTYFRRVTKCIPFSMEEICMLPMKHEARTNPDLKVERSVIEEVQMPDLHDVANKAYVLFEPSFKKAAG